MSARALTEEAKKHDSQPQVKAEHGDFCATHSWTWNSRF